MSLLKHTILGLETPAPPFDNTISWDETLTGPYADLSPAASQTQIDYGTVLGTDTYMHIPFINRIGNDLVITYQVGNEDEDVAGQRIEMKYQSLDGTLSSRIEVIPAFSNSGSTNEIVPISQNPIEVDGTWYYLASVANTNGVPTVVDWSAVGIIAAERTNSGTAGTPFWVHTPSGSAPTPESGFPAYTFNEPVSGAIRDKIASDDYQLYAYFDANASGFNGVLENGGKDFFEISKIKTGQGIVRLSRDFTDNTQRAFFDFGDGLPVQSDIPSSPARQHIAYLRDGRVAMCGGTTTAGRLDLWFAVADLYTLDFDAANIYKVISGGATGQVFPGAFKNGLWSYPCFLHDIDDKIKIVCSKYKEGIFLFEFPYSSL